MEVELAAGAGDGDFVGGDWQMEDADETVSREVVEMEELEDDGELSLQMLELADVGLSNFWRFVPL